MSSSLFQELSSDMCHAIQFSTRFVLETGSKRCPPEGEENNQYQQNLTLTYGYERRVRKQE